jgi:hypothetical protein
MYMSIVAGLRRRPLPTQTPSLVWLITIVLWMVVARLLQAALWSSSIPTPSCMPLVSGQQTFVDEFTSN